MTKFHISEADSKENSGWRILTWDIESLDVALGDAVVAAARSDRNVARISTSEEGGPWTTVLEIKIMNKQFGSDILE